MALKQRLGTQPRQLQTHTGIVETNLNTIFNYVLHGSKARSE
jgi:hypothetical protein